VQAAAAAAAAAGPTAGRPCCSLRLLQSIMMSERAGRVVASGMLAGEKHNDIYTRYTRLITRGGKIYAKRRAPFYH